MNKKTSSNKIPLTVGFFSVAFYFLSLLWSLFLTIPSQKIFHIQLLEVVLPGFIWISFWSFLWGVILSFLYGFIGAKIYIFIYKIINKFYTKEETET